MAASSGSGGVRVPVGSAEASAIGTYNGLPHDAGVAEQADASVSNTDGLTPHVGSIPTSGTRFERAKEPLLGGALVVPGGRQPTASAPPQPHRPARGGRTLERTTEEDFDAQR